MTRYRPLAAALPLAALHVGVATVAAMLLTTPVGAQQDGMKDMNTFPRPIEMPDNVWIEELTMLVDTAEGRALVEILIACRTDPALDAALAPVLRDWDAAVAAAAAARWDAPGGGADAALLWSITRSFVRGLMLHRRFVADEADLAAMVRRFATLIGPELTPRGEPGREP